MAKPEVKRMEVVILRYNLEEDTFAAIEVKIFTMGIVIQRRRNTKKGGRNRYLNDKMEKVSDLLPLSPH